MSDGIPRDGEEADAVVPEVEAVEDEWVVGGEQHLTPGAEDAIDERAGEGTGRPRVQGLAPRELRDAILCSPSSSDSSSKTQPGAGVLVGLTRLAAYAAPPLDAAVSEIAGAILSFAKLLL
jgi:hypothetical protein